MNRGPNIHQYFVYLLTNEWRNVLYTGVTNSLQTRVWQHKNKAVPGFTRKYNCDLLVFFEIFQDVKEAIAREKQDQGLEPGEKERSGRYAESQVD